MACVSHLAPNFLFHFYSLTHILYTQPYGRAAGHRATQREINNSHALFHRSLPMFQTFFYSFTSLRLWIFPGTWSPTSSSHIPFAVALLQFMCSFYFLKETVHQKRNHFHLFTYPDVVPKLYAVIFSWNTLRKQSNMHLCPLWTSVTWKVIDRVSLNHISQDQKYFYFNRLFLSKTKPLSYFLFICFSCFWLWLWRCRPQPGETS